MSEEDPIGYRNPPAHSRFKPGQSGNPAGRPKKTQGPLKIDLDALIDSPRTVRQGGREVQMSAYEAELRKQLEKAVKQDDLKVALYLLGEFEAHGAINPPTVERWSGHVELPAHLPQPVAVEALRQHGESPWSPAQLRPIIAAYLESRDEGDSIFDDKVGCDLNV